MHQAAPIARHTNLSLRTMSKPTAGKQGDLAPKARRKSGAKVAIADVGMAARLGAGTGTSPAAAPTETRRPDQIADRIVDAVLAGRLAPGQRLGEQALADLFGVSRTLVREAMARLSARGMVAVNARRGWFVVQPSLDEAREAFGARLALETGLLHGLAAPLPRAAIRRLKDHLASERPLPAVTPVSAAGCWVTFTSAWPNAPAIRCWPTS